eukprot:9591779-Ditylum_brightwellii.AAC.1
MEHPKMTRCRRILKRSTKMVNKINNKMQSNINRTKNKKTSKDVEEEYNYGEQNKYQDAT